MDRYFYYKTHADIIKVGDTANECRSQDLPNKNNITDSSDWNPEINCTIADCIIDIENTLCVEITKEEANRICKEWYKVGK